jgi:hypothetical protein
MMNKQKVGKRKMKINFYAVICILFTMGSMYNQGVYYYHVIGVILMITLSIVLEIARVSFLCDMFTRDRFWKAATIGILYFCVASWCFTANVIAFSVKFESKKIKSLSEFDRLFKKVQKKKIDLIDIDIVKHDKQNIQNAGLIKAGIKKDQITGIKEERIEQKMELINERLKISEIKPTNKDEFGQQVLLLGDSRDISTFNDISDRFDRDRKPTGILRISPETVTFIIEVAFALWLEVMIFYFGFRWNRDKSNSSQKEPKVDTAESKNVEIKSKFDNYLKDSDCKLWFSQFCDENVNIKRDGKGWPSVSLISGGKDKRKKFKELRDFYNNNQKFLEVK